MFATLLETKATRERRGWGTAVSVMAHGVVLLLLVVATRVDAHPRAPRGPVERPPIWTQRVDNSTHGGRAGAGDGSTRGAGRRFALPDPPLPGTDIDVAAPVDPSFALPGDSDVLGDIARSGAGDAGASAVDGGGIASELTVDERVGVLEERRPRYPEALREAGVTGVVSVRFVVDTTGHADLRSLRVMESPSDLLTDAVLTALRGTRFIPGRVRGHAVPTLVQRSVRFELEGAR